MPPGLSLIYELEGKIVGHILFSKFELRTTERSLRAVALAPMGVLPDHQKGEIGSALVEAGLSAARALGYEVAVVLGHTTYYPRFGFSLELGRKIQCQYSGNHFMALELKPGALAHVSEADGRYAAPFERLDPRPPRGAPR